MKREEAITAGDEERAGRHQVALERLHPIFYSELTAITRTEGRFGLKKKPKGDEYLGLLVREFRQVNETLVLGLDVIKSLVHPLLTCLSHAFPLTGF